MRELDADGRVWWGPTGDARPSIKRYLSEVGDLVPRTFWSKDAVGSNRTSKNEMRALFPDAASFTTPKPEALLKRVLDIATNPGDLVLDSFLGSGTTLIAAERTRGVLVLQLWMNGLNIALDFWFVLGLGWGVGGVADDPRSPFEQDGEANPCGRAIL